MNFLVLSLALLVPALTLAQESGNRWSIMKNGSIEWTIRPDDPHFDHIEMSGEKVSLWVYYVVDSLQNPKLLRTVMFPTFRLKPNDTHGTLMVSFTDNDLPRFFLDMTPLKPSLINGYLNQGLSEKVILINQSGIMLITSSLEKIDRARISNKLILKRTLLPSADLPAAIEKYVLINSDSRSCNVSMEYNMREIRIDTLHSTGGPHSVFAYTLNDGVKTLQPGDSAIFAIVYQAVKKGESLVKINLNDEVSKRIKRINDIKEPMQLITPDPVLNTAFAFAKMRAGESIYKTKNGYINSPGGFRYHAAIWANDQAEYTGPWYGYAGYNLGVEAALNAYRWFAKFMNPGFKPIPSSIIAEGIDFWDGAGDRGDQAMIAYGASRFALASGDRAIATELWPLIEWCLEFSRRKINSEGVVNSDSDELEGRFPAGKANLCTSSLYYDALLSASMLCKELGKPKQLSDSYSKQAASLRSSIEHFFGAKVEGYDTYRYYKENDVLRSWICMPLTVGIYERKAGTVDALFSPRLWTVDGLATQAGDKTFWDRSTLYGLRGVFAAGETGKALDYLKKYSERRLLGVHVPYPVEAYPEGDQKQLSGESALYCRVLTEGLFGLRPTGLRSFSISPKLPEGWNEMALNKITAFGNTFDIGVKREGTKTIVNISRQGEAPIVKKWDGKGPLNIKL
ncbi:MAG: hypothetical protein NTV01_18840 [Bacteroidia bacterium]|nr:hypothetical protein [Bacteroidia bacterium]